MNCSKAALGGKGKSGGRGGGTGGEGRGGQGRGQRQELPLEDILHTLLGEQKTVSAGKAPGGRNITSESAAVDVCPEGDTASAVMTGSDEAALSCLAAHIVSFTDGRVRLRHPALRAAAVPEELRRELLERPGLDDVTFNAVTGSVLLLYDAGQQDRPGVLAELLPLGRYLVQASSASDETV